MGEDLNDNDLEAKIYPKIHHVDNLQINTALKSKNDANSNNAPQKLVRRYWHTVDNHNPYQKINITKDKSSTKNPQTPMTDISTLKEITSNPSEAHGSTELSVFQSPVPQTKSIIILENDATAVVELESSDEDEIIEVALPPKPTITIDSSDEEENVLEPKLHSSPKELSPGVIVTPSKREVSASPVPSVVSSVSDEFIRSDCIALKISSKKPDNPSFDFSLHGSDLIDTPPRKKKKKRPKGKDTSLPTYLETPDKVNTNNDGCFATPKSRTKNMRQQTKSYTGLDISLPNPDVYDTDSNHSTDIARTKSYVVSEKSLPSTDVYESDSSQPELIKEPVNAASRNLNIIDKPINKISSKNNSLTETPKAAKKTNPYIEIRNAKSMLDLTNCDDETIVIDDNSINENIVMGNVTGFTETSPIIEDRTPQRDISKLGSTNVPAILNEDVDFDNLKGTGHSCKRKYSLTTLRAEMEKFYNESWGGENFNHREIQKNMSRDKNLWAIDPKDRMPAQFKKKVCNYCNRPGHRDDLCKQKTPVCHMCGSIGHYEPRCPRKICVNCGSPNHMYSTMCRNCASWGRITCSECGQLGHPPTHCPDLWRRYHNTIDLSPHLEEVRQMKKNSEMFCSGCTRRGHQVHTCRLYIPFSSLPINSPYVSRYNPVYFPQVQNNYGLPQNNCFSNNNAQASTVSSASLMSTPFRSDRNKRQSKSPTAHENHVNKKRNLSMSDAHDNRSKNDNVKNKSLHDDKLMQQKTPDNTNTKPPGVALNSDTKITFENLDKAPDFIPLSSVSNDKSKEVIQDNEVSDTSGVVTSARMYVTNDVLLQLKLPECVKWLDDRCKKHNVVVQHTQPNMFLLLKGKIEDQDSFQSEFKDWIKEKQEKQVNRQINLGNSDNTEKLQAVNNIPKYKNNVLRVLGKAFESLKEDLGDPNALYKELLYLQNQHQHLLKQKTVSPKKVSNSRTNMNSMLKKLNMILLGQAGLADGSKHLNELYNLLEKVSDSDQKKLGIRVRQEIGKHYDSIFTAMPRDDYIELLEKYHGNNKQNGTFKKINKSVKYNNILKSIPDANIKSNCNLPVNKVKPVQQLNCEPIAKILSDLIGIHRRITRSQPVESALKRTRFILVRKFHIYITSLTNRQAMSSKTLKKIRKCQNQAQLFLAKV